MNCETLSERMPLVASGQSAWLEEEQRHLEECAGCRTEWRTVKEAFRVVADLPSSFDPVRISAGVLHRLERAPPARSHRSAPWWYAGAGIAAVLLLVFLLPGERGETGSHTDQEAVWTIPVMGLDSLDEDQLRMVLESIDEPLETPSSPMVPSTLDLNDQQLERLVRSLEG